MQLSDELQNYNRISDLIFHGSFLQIQRGNLQIVDAAGSELNPRKIEAYSAAYTTSLTLPLAEAMNILMKPMVGYRAGGSELDNRFKYPYYIRALPGIYEEMRAIVLFLKKMNWNYVQASEADFFVRIIINLMFLRHYILSTFSLLFHFVCV